MATGQKRLPRIVEKKDSEGTVCCAGDVSARPSDYIQSRPGEDKITKFPGKPSVSGNQASKHQFLTDLYCYGL